MPGAMDDYFKNYKNIFAILGENKRTNTFY